MIILFFLSLSITVRPESRPEILGFFDEYTLDKAIDALCTSKRSYPAAQLDFFINDEPVSLGIYIYMPNIWAIVHLALGLGIF